MKQTILLLAIAALLAGCRSSYPPHTMYSEYGFTYDYRPSAKPLVINQPVREESSAPTFVVQVPPPTVIYQTAPTTVQSSSETNTLTDVSTSSDPNPYKGTYVIPPKVIPVSEQTVIHDAAGAVINGSVTNTVTHQPVAGAGYPAAVGAAGAVTNDPSANVNITNANPVSITNTVTDPSGTQRTNVPAPATPPPRTENSAAPAPGTQNGTEVQNGSTIQSTTGTGAGGPAHTTTGGSFAPPPPGSTPLPVAPRH
jgi:hypothetical protein